MVPEAIGEKKTSKGPIDNHSRRVALWPFEGQVNWRAWLAHLLQVPSDQCSHNTRRNHGTNWWGRLVCELHGRDLGGSIKADTNDNGFILVIRPAIPRQRPQH